MAQKEKELLLIDLYARLPYGVIVEITSDGGMVEASYDMRLDAGLLADLLHCEDDFKPYLRPMSSMTEGEIFEFIKIGDSILRIGEKKLICILSLKQMDWLNAHHFDYRGLIEKGLAIEVTKENNPYEN